MIDKERLELQAEIIRLKTELEHYQLRSTHTEIAKRMVEKYRSLYAENPDTKTPWLDGFDNWLDMEKR